MTVNRVFINVRVCVVKQKSFLENQRDLLENVNVRPLRWIQSKYIILYKSIKLPVFFEFTDSLGLNTRN